MKTSCALADDGLEFFIASLVGPRITYAQREIGNVPVRRISGATIIVRENIREEGVDVIVDEVSGIRGNELCSRKLTNTLR